MPSIDDPALFGALMDATVDAIVISDAQGVILRVNPAATALFQHEGHALVGRNVRILMPDVVGGQHDAMMARYLATGQGSVIGRSREVQGVRADGSKVPLRLSLGRAETDLGPVFVSVLHDLTEQVAMRVAAERSQKMDAIGRMTGGIAHDFNNLLTVIIGNLELLDVSALSGHQARLLRDALSAAELGADLTSRLNIFARKSDLKPKVFDLNAAVGEALALLHHTIGSHCRIVSHCRPGLWPVAADPSQFQTAILNLALNAQDAMPDGGVLSIETQNVSIDDAYMAQELDVAPGRYVRLTLSDTGRGMEPEESSRSLEPFFTTKPAGHGTGLGLPIVYGFVKQSGGYLTIYSEPGDGTTISLYFPAADQDGPVAASGDPTGQADRQGPTGGTILVVEDNEKLRHLTEERLRSLGFDCIPAGTADDAWRLLDEGLQVDLVFTDMVMPGAMSGYDLAQRIGQYRPEIAVLLTSGFSESVLKDRWIEDDWRILRKPYRMADLEQAIQVVLGRA